MSIPRGIRLDIKRARKLQTFSAEAITKCKEELRKLGFSKIDMDPRKQMPRKSLINYFSKKGLIDHFPLSPIEGTPSFGKESLQDLEDADDSIQPLLTIKKMQRVIDDPFYSGSLCNAEGRFLFTLNSLGADSGRDTSSSPNIIGIGKRERPLIIAGENCGLVELDVGQEEPLVGGYLSNDRGMINAYYESDDLYAQMRSKIFGDLLSEIEKKKFRDVCKIIMFGLLYGMGPKTMALKMKSSVRKAEEYMRLFREAYPNITYWREAQPILLRQRGYAMTIGGMKRYRGREGSLSDWERRWAVNTPIQGSASDILKHALVEMHEPLAALGARVILPVYDAVLVESPLKHFKDATKIARHYMVEAFRYFFPDSAPRIDINDKNPGTWCKPCDADEKYGMDSLDRFFKDPLMPFEGYPEMSL